MGNLEIYRAFFVAFGAMEVLTNFRYLIRKNGIELARKQHQELPKDISDRQMKAVTIDIGKPLVSFSLVQWSFWFFVFKMELNFRYHLINHL